MRAGLVTEVVNETQSLDSIGGDSSTKVTEQEDYQNF